MQADSDLLARCRKNDRKAHNELYRQCFGYLLVICHRYSNNKEDAKALLNQGFLKIITNLDKFNEDVPFGSWIGRIMVNTIIDEFRKNKKRRENMSSLEIDEVHSMENVDFNEASQNLDAEALEQMIQQLPETSKKVFNLYAIDGYTHKEIGELLNISDGTSKWHVSHARKVLQAVLKKTMRNMMTITL